MASGPAFAVRHVSEVHYGPGRARAIADDAAALGDRGKPVVLVANQALLELGVATRLMATLEAAGAEIALFAEIAAEPNQAQVEAATEFVRRNQAGLGICLGGGSAMDVGKVAATVALTKDGPAAFAMEGKPLPRGRVPKICLPTTTGISHGWGRLRRCTTGSLPRSASRSSSAGRSSRTRALSRPPARPVVWLAMARPWWRGILGS